MRKKQAYILYLWVEEGDVSILQGMLQSVKSGDKLTFANVDELLALLRSRLQQNDSVPAEDSSVEELSL